MTIIRIGLDTAKHVFQVHGVDESETAVLRVIEYGAAIDFWRKLLESHQRRSAKGRRSCRQHRAPAKRR